MRVIKHGNTYKTAECPFCECKFTYVKKDIENVLVSSGNIRVFVSCPECGMRLNKEYLDKVME